MLKQLRLKFIIINMVLVTLMLCVIFGMVCFFTARGLETESMQAMQAVAATPQQKLPDRQESNTEPKAIRHPYILVQIDQEGDMYAVSGGGLEITEEDEAYLREIIRAADDTGEQNGTLKDYCLRFCYVQAGPVTNLVFLDMTSEITTMRSLVQTCIFIGILALAVFCVLSVLLARWSTRPVDTAWHQQQQFVADASHELKTPLTVILTNAELLQDPDCDEDARMQFSGSILSMAHQMRGLVEGLLELARVDNGAVRTCFAPVDLSDLVSDCTLPFEPMFYEKDLMLQTIIKPELCVQGSEQHLRQVVEILLDNALKYSTSNGPVQVGLVRQERHALLTVAGCGDEISREDLKNIFRRFYRIDKARTMNHSYGLGLSIAERITTEHGGKIWAESEYGVNTFFVQLPLRQAGKV